MRVVSKNLLSADGIICFSRMLIPKLLKSFKAKLRVSKVAVCCFSWGICYDFYGVKSAAGG
jgi:hypothetical protein